MTNRDPQDAPLPEYGVLIEGLTSEMAPVELVHSGPAAQARVDARAIAAGERPDLLRLPGPHEKVQVIAWSPDQWGVLIHSRFPKSTHLIRVSVVQIQP